MVLRLNQPLTEYHLFYGGPIIFGRKKSMPPAKSAAGSEPEDTQSTQDDQAVPSDPDGKT